MSGSATIVEGLLRDVRPETADEAVVAAAARLFLRDGLSQVKMTDVAEEAGVGVATIYRHFQTKVRLAAAAGTLIWRLINQQILAFVESGEFLAMTGLERLARLLGQYSDAYAAMPEFVAFLAAFDQLAIAEAPAGGDELAADMAAYGEVVDSFYLLFEDAYLLGLQDGTVACELDFRTFYQAVAHALMGAAEKLARGRVIPSDASSDGRAEIACIVDMAVRSLTVTTGAK